MLDAQPIEVLLDAAISPLGRGFEGKSLLDPLDGSGDGGSNPLDAALHGRLEVRDVAFPSWSPLVGLMGDACLGTGEHHIERGESTNASGAEAEVLGGTGSGDADRHDGCFRGYLSC